MGRFLHHFGERSSARSQAARSNAAHRFATPLDPLVLPG